MVQIRYIAMAGIQKLNVQTFPRPPALQKISRHIQIKWDGHLIADTKDAYWVLETHHPPSKCSHQNLAPPVASNRFQQVPWVC